MCQRTQASGMQRRRLSHALCHKGLFDQTICCHVFRHVHAPCNARTNARDAGTRGNVGTRGSRVYIASNNPTLDTARTWRQL